MTRGKALALLSGPLRFGDAKQIEARRFLEQVAEAIAARNACAECGGEGSALAACAACGGSGETEVEVECEDCDGYGYVARRCGCLAAFPADVASEVERGSGDIIRA